MHVDLTAARCSDTSEVPGSMSSSMQQVDGAANFQQEHPDGTTSPANVAKLSNRVTVRGNMTLQDIGYYYLNLSITITRRKERRRVKQKGGRRDGGRPMI